MIDNICTFLTNRIRKEMPEVDDEKAEIIFYGLQNILGEIPKTILLFLMATVLGILKETVITFILIMPYRSASGGFHLKSHMGCILGTSLYYFGIVFLSKYVVFSQMIKYVTILLIWIFGMIMIKKYAPADTENVPILSKKIRRKNQILAYVFFSIGLVIAGILNNNVISNILIFGNLIQTLTITKLAYRLTKNKYGYEVYQDTSIQNA